MSKTEVFSCLKIAFGEAQISLTKWAIAEQKDDSGRLLRFLSPLKVDFGIKKAM
jgi:hypothetical protein